MADGGIRIDVGLNISKAEKDLEKLKVKIAQTEATLAEQGSRRSAIEEKLSAARAEAEATRGAIEDTRRALNEMEDIYSGKTGMPAGMSIDEFLKLPEEISAATAALADHERVLKENEKEAEALEKEYQNVTENIEQGTKKLSGMKEEAGDLQRQLASAKPGEAIAKSLETAKKSIWKFVKYAIGIRTVYALFNRLRNAIKNSVAAFAEYDKETKYNLKLIEATKKAIQVTAGAALAGIYNAILPIIQKILNWTLEAANAAAKFIAILSGKSTYKKAVVNASEVAESLEDTAEEEEDVTENAKEMKKQLLGFDELNILSNDAAESNKSKNKNITKKDLDGIDMIEEAVDDGSKIAKFAEFIRDHLKEIEAIVIAIGAALALWKLAGIVSKFMEMGNAIQLILGLVIGIAGSIVYVKGFFDAWKNGLDGGNLAELISGAALAIGGFALAFGPVGGAIASFVTGIGLMILGVKEWIKTGELSTESFIALAAGIGAVALGITLLTGNFIPLLIAAIAILVLAIATYGDEMQQTLQAFDDYLQNIFAKDWTEVFGPVLGGALNTLLGIVKYVWDNLKLILDGIIDFITGVFTGDWERAWNGLKEIFLGAWNLLFGWIPRLITWLQGACEQVTTYLNTTFKTKMEEFFGPILSKPVIAFVLFWHNLFQSVVNFVAEYLESLKTIFNGIIMFVKGVFTRDWTLAWQGVKNIFIGIFDGLATILKVPINGIIGLINKAISGLNTLIEGANRIPGVSIPYISSIPLLARGGVLKRGQIGILEGSGAEAVVPLEQNTGWMNLVADSLMERFQQNDFANQLAEAFASTPLPAMAGGSIVPPNAASGGWMSFEGMASEVRQGVYDAIMALGGMPKSRGGFTMNVNGKEFMRATYDDRKAVDKEHGISLISG